MTPVVIVVLGRTGVDCPHGMEVIFVGRSYVVVGILTEIFKSVEARVVLAVLIALSSNIVLSIVTIGVPVLLIFCGTLDETYQCWLRL